MNDNQPDPTEMQMSLAHPSPNSDRSDRATRWVTFALLAIAATGCMANFSKRDNMSDDEIAATKLEAQRRVAAGQRLQILKEQMRAGAAAAGSGAPAPAPAPAPAAPAPAASGAPAPAPAH